MLFLIEFIGQDSISFQNLVYAYVFTRLQYPPCEMNDEILEILAECGIDDDYLIDQDQNGCTAC